MNKRFLQITVLILVGIISGFGQTNAWNSIVPLRSTRADVEKLLGAPKEFFYGTFKYDSKDGKVHVDYSTRKCDGAWNVSVDTVLSITVYPASLEGKNLKELKIDESKFSMTADDTFTQTWTNPEEGLQYRSDGRDKFLSITYLPKKSDNDFRCNGFPPFAPEGRHMRYEYTTFYSQKLNRGENINNVCARFGNVLFQLRENWGKDYKGYAMVYFDNKLPLKQYEKYFAGIKYCVFNQMKFPPERLAIIEGGLREESLIEFYILPTKWKPPAPNPTLPSPQFMRKQ